MVNSDDQIAVQPTTQPKRASGMFSPVPTSSLAMPASRRMRSQPGPKGRTFL